MSGAVQSQVLPRSFHRGLVLPAELRQTLEQMFASCPIQPGAPIGSGAWSRTVLTAFSNKNEELMKWAEGAHDLPRVLLELEPGRKPTRFTPIFSVLNECHGTTFLVGQLSEYRKKKVSRELSEEAFIGPFDMPSIRGKSLPLLTALVAALYHPEVLDPKRPEQKPVNDDWKLARDMGRREHRAWHF